MQNWWQRNKLALKLLGKAWIPFMLWLIWAIWKAYYEGY